MPRVPLVSGWVDRDRGVELLREALARSDRDPRNLLFLAEALLDLRPAEKSEARALLERVAARAPANDEMVEQSEVLAEARRRLSELAPEGSG